MDIPNLIADDWSRYQELQNSGLKKQANKALNQIVALLEGREDADIKYFLFNLCDNGLNAQRANKIQHPLFVKCIIPWLLDGFERKSAPELFFIVKAAKYGYWQEIYKFFGDVSTRELLKTALESDTDNKEMIAELISDFISEFEFGAHHLPENIVLDLSLINKSISECSAFILKYRKQIDSKTVESFKYYSKLYKDYSEWDEEVTKLSFLSWCIHHDKKYHWVNPDYI
jgi:hypothetical protein